MFPTGIRSRATNPQKLAVDDRMFFNFIRTSPNCAGALNNYADMFSNCARTLSSDASALSDCTRMFRNCIAWKPAEIALILANGRFARLCKSFCLTCS